MKIKYILKGDPLEAENLLELDRRRNKTKFTLWCPTNGIANLKNIFVISDNIFLARFEASVNRMTRSRDLQNLINLPRIAWRDYGYCFKEEFGLKLFSSPVSKL